MKWLLAALALAAGALVPLQALVNAQLGRHSAGALFASVVSFFVGTAALCALLIASRQPLPTLDALQRLPAWMWMGGLIGAFFVSVATLAIPRLGASTMVALFVLGQMAASLVYDALGVLHDTQPVSGSRLFGALLVLVGVLLVMQPWKLR